MFTRDVAPVDDWNLYGMQTFFMAMLNSNDGKCVGLYLHNTNAMGRFNNYVDVQFFDLVFYQTYQYVLLFNCMVCVRKTSLIFHPGQSLYSFWYPSLAKNLQIEPKKNALNWCA